MKSSYPLALEPYLSGPANAQTIVETRIINPLNWWEQIRLDAKLKRLISSILGVGFYDSLLHESGENLKIALVGLFAQYRGIIRERLPAVEAQIEQFVDACFTRHPAKFAAARYDCKGQARIYRAVLAGFNGCQELNGWLTFALTEASVVIDLCAGTGQISQVALAPLHCRRIACDLSFYMLKDGIQSGFLRQTLGCLSFAERIGSFIKRASADLIFLCFGIDTVAKPKQVLFEINRILAYSGNLVLVIPLPLRIGTRKIEQVLPEDRISEGVDFLDDLVNFHQTLSNAGLQTVRWGVTTYYHCDVQGLCQSAAFVLVAGHRTGHNFYSIRG